MANVLTKERQLMVLRLLVEGSSLRSIERTTGVQKKTAARLMVKFGEKCRDFLDRQMRGLTLDHVQVDEIWTFVQKKQGRLTMEEREERWDIGDQYLWVVFDQRTKLIPTFAIGKRTADMARRLMVDLSGRLVKPLPHESDAHYYRHGTYKPVVRISTDGFAGYPEAVDLAFGPHCQYGQLIKDYRNADQPGRYAAPELIGAQRRPIYGEMAPKDICTSHVERNNLTIRTLMRRFTRLSLGFSKKLENLAAATAIYVAYFNYCWRPRKPGKTGRRGPTPAMAAKVTDSLWSLEELYGRVLAN